MITALIVIGWTLLGILIFGLYCFMGMKIGTKIFKAQMKYHNLTAKYKDIGRPDGSSAVLAGIFWPVGMWAWFGAKDYYKDAVQEALSVEAQKELMRY